VIVLQEIALLEYRHRIGRQRNRAAGSSCHGEILNPSRV
jgi:hypothetical protein